MAVILDSTDPGALIAHAFLSLFYSFGIFFYNWADYGAKCPRCRPWPPPPIPYPCPTPKTSTWQDLPKCPARGLVNPKGVIPFASDNFISSANLPKESNPYITFLKAQDDSIAKIMSLGLEGRLLGFIRLGPFCAHCAEQAVAASPQCPAFPF